MLLTGKVLTSVRGSSASRLAAGIWSSRGLFEEDDDDEDDVVCSENKGPQVAVFTGINSIIILDTSQKFALRQEKDQPLGPLSLVLSRVATRSLSSSSLRKSRARTSSGASCVGCLNFKKKKTVHLKHANSTMCKCVCTWLCNTLSTTHISTPFTFNLLTCTWSLCDLEDLDLNTALTAHSNPPLLYLSLL